MKRIEGLRPTSIVSVATPGAVPTPAPPPATEPPWPKSTKLGAVVEPPVCPVEALAHLITEAEHRLQRLADRALPSSVAALIDWYLELGWAQASCEAALLGALDALDPRTGGGVAEPRAVYAAMRQRAFAALARVGEAFDRVEPAFAQLVHQGAAWPAQPIQVADDRGDGRPLYHYQNSFKRQPGLTAAERRAEYDKRVADFVAKGGRFEDIITATPGVFDRLTAGVRYDYVMDGDGTLRLYPTPPRDDDALAKPGHSLLAVGGPEFRDVRALLAGEIWVYRDTAGDTECVVVANNSGHFKPTFADLPNALPHLARLGLPADRVILFGGPNNLPSMLAEIGRKCGVADAGADLPPPAADLLTAATRSARPLALRAGPIDTSSGSR